MGIAYNPRIVTDGLVLCLDAADKRSYPGAGTTWTDRSANGNNGTLINGPMFDSANGGGIVFDGTNDYCVTNNSKSDFTSSNEITISIWFQLLASTNVRGLLQFGTGLTDNYPWIIIRTNGVSLSWYLNNSYRINHSFSINTIYNLCLTFKNNLWSAYKNNALDGTYSGGLGSYSGADFKLATAYNGPSNINFYICCLYNRALSADEIRQNYNATKGRFNV